MKEYTVGVTMYNSYEVWADSEEEAVTIVREMSSEEVMADIDFNIAYID